MTHWNIRPDEIEKRSFEIIEKEVGPLSLEPSTWTIIRRMIHTSADFEYLSSTRVHPDAVKAGIRALRAGCNIYTDTNMALAGISTGRLKKLGVRSRCLIAEEETMKKAREEGITRAFASVDLALAGLNQGIYVVGNAPTALFRLLEHVENGRANPALIIGLPVGFVNAAESKAALLKSKLPSITNVGRKGGSNIAAAALNALAIMALEIDEEKRT